MRQDYIHVTAEDDEDFTEPPPRERAGRNGRERPQELPFETEGDGPAENSPPTKLFFDPMRLVEAVARRWWMWIGAGLLLGGAAFGYVASHTKTIVTMQLIRQDPPTVFHVGDANDAFKPHQFTDAALTTVIRSPGMLRTVSERAHLGLTPGMLGTMIGAVPDDNSELVNLIYSGPFPPATAVNILTVYSDEIIKATKELEAREGRATAAFLAQKVKETDASLTALRTQVEAIPAEQRIIDPDQLVASTMVQLQNLDVQCDVAKMELEAANPVAQRLQEAKDQLAALRAQYFDNHPKVQDKLAEIKALEEELTEENSAPLVSTNGAVLPLVTKQNAGLSRQLEQLEKERDGVEARLKSLSKTNSNYALLKNRLDAVQQMRTTLASREHEAEVYASDASGYYRVFRPAAVQDAATKRNWKKAIMGGVGGGVFGAGLVMLCLMFVEVVDPRLKTVGDVERATGLPVLATLGDTSEMTEEEKRAWAFRTWTIIKGKITASQTHSLVCGVISARPGEGRSTWVNLLAKTAFDRGMKVVVAEPQETFEPPVHPHGKNEARPDFTRPQIAEESTPQPPNAVALPLTGNSHSKPAKIPSGFKFPTEAARQLGEGAGPSLVHIPLPGWAWNLEARKEWRDGLAEWEKIENMIFLVELPAATCPEAVLLAENVPQLIWLAKSGEAGVVETKKHLETLRHAGCNLVGAALNCEKSWLRKRFGAWMAVLVMGFGLAFGAQAQTANTTVGLTAIAQPTNSPSEEPGPYAHYGPQPTERAPWQQHLTLGPGDVLTFQFYGDTNLTKENVVVGMDGRIGYLQAHDVPVTGMTVDELRDRLDNILGAYYRTPRVMITPVAYRSQKYFVLGKVTAPGAYVLDQPVTIVEALARAKGLASGLVDRTSIDLADLGRSFLIRDGRRVAIDFERLFQQGDFSQNVSLRPNDFLYFAPANLKEVYVLGQVRNPGSVPYAPNKTVIGAIAERGGFTDTAWKNRVLIVRGSLTHPDVYSVDTWTVLDARGRDFRLQPRDIVYVANRPFFYGEELLDVAVTAFLQSAVTDWTAAYITIFDRPIIPHP